MPAIIRCLRSIDVTKISITRGFATKLPAHKTVSQVMHALPRSEPTLEYGLDYEHWFVQVKLPDCEMSRDEIIDYYINILTEVVGSEEKTRLKIYFMSTKHYFAFGVLGDEELASKLQGLCKVLAVYVNYYLDPKNKNNGGNPFINKQPVPYDRKYHTRINLSTPEGDPEIPYDNPVAPDIFLVT
ncbi:multiple organellar RNA editing factor 8, chloroplastic/mitochondrial-like [Apium graveolens]|uniref:multiple organellar RNA editing factor 8, chloroplastic/mitochondrial-like n=1 Tax=Apium graveolens TaxID=4045 RepID=UPI003D7B87A3